MELTTDPYGFSATHVEGLFLRLARKVLEIQESSTLNTDSLQIVTVDTDETGKTASVAIAEVFGNFGPNMELEIINPFEDSLNTTGAAAPWNKTNHLDALLHVGIWLCNQERSLQINTRSKFVFSYSLTSQGDVVEPDFSLVLNAENIPLDIAHAGQTTSSQASEWLTGKVS